MISPLSLAARPPLLPPGAVPEALNGVLVTYEAAGGECPGGPCGFTAEGLPVALQIVGRWHDDSTVLRAAACFEADQPWTERRPEVP